MCPYINFIIRKVFGRLLNVKEKNNLFSAFSDVDPDSGPKF